MENKPERNVQGPRAPRWPLPYWEPAQTVKQELARIKNGMHAWVRSTSEDVYKWGKGLQRIKDSRSVPHGEFSQRVAELGIKMRTAQNWMRHARECDDAKRILPYHPNPKALTKNATVALLESPEDPEEQQKLKRQRPRHESEPLNWSAAETAETIFEIFEKLTQRRKIEEMEDVADQLAEKIREYIDNRREERLMIRGHHGQLRG